MGEQWLFRGRHLSPVAGDRVGTGGAEQAGSGLRHPGGEGAPALPPPPAHALLRSVLTLTLAWKELSRRGIIFWDSLLWKHFGQTLSPVS